MYYILKSELKRKFKSPLIWILILITMILLYINMERSYEENQLGIILSRIPGIYEISEEEKMGQDYKEDLYGNSYEDYIARSSYHLVSPSLYETWLNNYEMDKAAYLNNSSRERIRLSAFSSLLSANIQANSTNNNHGVLSKYMVQIANNELWDKVSGGISYDDIDFYNTELLSNLYGTIQSAFNTRYYYYLYDRNIQPIETHEFNNLYLLYNWMVKIIPFMLVIFSILLSYDLINKDVQEGSVKLLISQSIPRWKYYLSKFIAGTIIVVFTLIVPLLVSNIYLKAQVKSYPMDYPIVYDQQGLTQFKPSFNYKEKNYEIYEKDQYMAFYTMPYSTMDNVNLFNEVPVYPLYQRNTELIPFSRFILLSLLFGLLFIMFMVAFTQLLSALFNNIILSIFATSGIYAGLYFLFQPYLYEKNYNLSPFTMNNSARIVAGTHNVTMLTAFLILSLSTLILLLIGVSYFKKKNI